MREALDIHRTQLAELLDGALDPDEELRSGGRAAQAPRPGQSRRLLPQPLRAGTWRQHDEMTGRDSFGAEEHARGRETGSYRIHRLSALEGVADLERLPYSIKLLLENLLRHEDGVSVEADDVEALARFADGVAGDREIAYSPARILLQDFTGVPCVVDLAAMRDAIEALGGRARADQPARARRPRDRPLGRRRRLRPAATPCR